MPDMTETILLIQCGTYRAEIVIPAFLDEMPNASILRLFRLGLRDWRNRLDVDELREIVHEWAASHEDAAALAELDRRTNAGDAEIADKAKSTMRKADKAKRLKMQLDKLLEKQR